MPVRMTMATSTVLLTMLDLTRDGGEPYGNQLALEAGLKSGVVYPILARLESAGWVTSRWDDARVQRGSRRRYYQFTPDGIAHARRRLGINPDPDGVPGVPGRRFGMRHARRPKD